MNNAFRHAETNDAAHGRRVAERLPHFVTQVDQPLGIDQAFAPLGRECRQATIVFVALEQADAEKLLKLVNPRRNHWLGNLEVRGRLAETARLLDR